MNKFNLLFRLYIGNLKYIWKNKYMLSRKEK